MNSFIEFSQPLKLNGLFCARIEMNLDLLVFCDRWRNRIKWNHRVERVTNKHALSESEKSRVTVKMILFFYLLLFFRVMNAEPCKNRAREMIHVICQKFDCSLVSLAELTLSLSRHVLKCLQVFTLFISNFLFLKIIVCLEATYQYKT